MPLRMVNETRPDERHVTNDVADQIERDRPARLATSGRTSDAGMRAQSRAATLRCVSVVATPAARSESIHTCNV